MITNKAVKRAALEEVNKIRCDLGLEPIDTLSPGVKKSPRACPIALSIGADCTFVLYSSIEAFMQRDALRVCIPTPKAIQRLIHRFDRGLLRL